MKKTLSLLVFAAALLLCACDNDDYATGAEPPVFDTFTLSKYTDVEPEEEITGTVTYKYEGRDVIRLVYAVSAIAPGGASQTISTGELIGEALKNPTFKFNAPKDAGSYRIHFQVNRVSVSTGNAQGGPYVSNPAGLFAKSVLVVK
ncbi:MAG: hypothetical protein IKG96_07570 [Bacteroidaceae bacterium]|jgi:hypothetical protein|nr:hypothetical protein [Bacteroidaceae bacterium]